MVFYGLRKFARELGLEVQSGVVCGIYERYAVSMWEGNGYKTFSISAKFEEELCNKMEIELMDLEGNYRRVVYIRFIEGVLEARFLDNPGTVIVFLMCFLFWMNMRFRMQIFVQNADFPCMVRVSGLYLRYMAGNPVIILMNIVRLPWNGK